MNFWQRNTLANLVNHWLFTKFYCPNFNNVSSSLIITLMTQIKKATNRNLPTFYSPKVCDGKFVEVFLCQTITLHWQHKHICKYAYTGRAEFGVINDVFALGFTQSTTFCFRTVFLHTQFVLRGTGWMITGTKWVKMA